jgi:hypothetical protein
MFRALQLRKGGPFAQVMLFNNKMGKCCSNA